MKARIALNGHTRDINGATAQAFAFGRSSRVHTRAETRGGYHVERVYIGDQISESEFMLTRRLRGISGDLEQPYTEHEWIYAACNAKATEFSSVPIRVRRWRRGDENDEGIFIPFESPIAAFLDQPNPDMTGQEFLELLSLALDLWGCLFGIMFDRAGNPFEPGPGRVPAEVWPVHPAQMTPIIEGRVVVGWIFEYREGNTTKKQKLTDGQVARWREINPYNSQGSVGPAQVVTRSARTDWKAGRYTEALLDNGADPGGTLVTDDYLTRGQTEELRNNWNDRHQGETKGGRIAVLQGGMKYVPNPVTIKDMQFPEQRKWTREGILAALRVPKMLLGLIEDVNRSTAREVLKLWWTHTLIPRQEKVVAVFNRGIFNAFGKGSQLVYAAEFDNSKVEALQEDLGEKFDNGKKLKDLGYPVNAINARLGLGMEDLEWGDEVLDAPNKVPVSELVAAPGAYIGAGAPGDGAEPKALTAPLTLERGVPRGEDFAKLAPKIKLAIYHRVFFHPNEKRVSGALRKTYRELQREQIARVRAWARGELKRYEDDVRSWELDPSEKAPRIPKLTEDEIERILISAREWGSALSDGLGSSVQGVTANALGQVESELGGFNVVDPADEKWLLQTNKRVAQMVKLGVQDRRTVRAVLLQFSGTNLANLREIELSLTQAFSKDIMPVWRATTIARTETGILASEIRHETFRQEGVEDHEWVTRADEHVRDTQAANHDAMDGERTEVGKPFSNGLLHPLDPRGPAEEIINCRCTAFAVPKEV